jgi:hypothetical protein
MALGWGSGRENHFQRIMRNHTIGKRYTVRNQLFPIIIPVTDHQYPIIPYPPLRNMRNRFVPLFMTGAHEQKAKDSVIDFHLYLFNKKGFLFLQEAFCV